MTRDHRRLVLGRLGYHHLSIVERSHQRHETRHRAKRAIQPEFGQEPHLVDRPLCDHLLDDEQPNGNGKIETGTSTLHRRAHRQIDGDPPIRPGQIARQERGTNSITRFATRLVWLTDDGEAGQTHPDVHFDFHGLAMDAEQAC